MSRLAITRNAARYLTDTDREQIAVIAPRDAVVSIGYARNPGEWACRILVGSRVVGDAFGARTPMSAFLRAMDGSREANA